MSMVRLTEHVAQVYVIRRLEHFPNLIIQHIHPSVSLPVPVVSNVISLDSQHLFQSIPSLLACSFSIETEGLSELKSM